MAGVAYIPSRLKYPIPPNEDTVPLLKYAKVPVSTLEELPFIYPDPLPHTYMFVEEISMLAFYDSELLEWKPMQDTTVSDWARKGVQPADVLIAIGAQPKLISGQNIKTINGESLLASGDIVITGDGGNAATVNGFTVNANVPAGAKFTDTIYSHPATHPASMIVQDATRRFVTDAQIAQWNAYELPVGLSALNALQGKGFVYKTGEATWGLIDDVFTITRNEDGTVKSVLINGDLFSSGEVTAYFGTEGGGDLPGDGTGGASNFMELLDVDPASITAGKYLQWNGNKVVGAYVNAATVNGFTVNANVPTGAKFTDTVYSHPATHSASMIAQDATRRFVTDAEKATWNTISTHNHNDLYEPKFSKNSAFNKNFGTSSGTVAQGNDSRINNGRTAYGWGNHASAGYASASALNSHISDYNTHVSSNLHLTQAQRDVLAKLSIVNGNLRVSTNIYSTGEVTAFG